MGEYLGSWQCIHCEALLKDQQHNECDRCREEQT